MKKIVLLMVFCVNILLASDAILGEFGSSQEVDNGVVTFDAGIWFMNWDQTSTSSEMLRDSTDAIEMNYKIDSSVAYIVALKLNYWNLSGTIEYSDNSFGSESEDSIDNLNIGLALLDYIPYIDVELRYVKSNFSGYMSAIDNNETDLNKAYGSSTFTSKVDIFDIIIYPFNDYLGVGYRNYNYEFPQDAYITHDKSGDSIAGGLMDFAYEGYFYTVSFDNKKMVDIRNNYNGLVYSVTLGSGKLTPTTLVNEKTSSSDAEYFNNYLGDSDAMFYDVLLGYSYRNKGADGFGYGFTMGYRYNKIEVDASDLVDNNGYSIVTKFDTEFYGPYINLVVNY